MLGDIDLSLKPQENVLTIHAPYGEEIGEIIINKQLLACTYTAKFNDVDELSLQVPYEIFDSNFKLIKNPYWDHLKGNYLLKLNNEKYFIITYPTKIWDGSKDYKELKCYSYEYILSKKKIRGLKDTLVLYDTVGTSGVLNLLEKNTSWRVDFVDEDALNEQVSGQTHLKYRTFDISESTWLDFLTNEASNSFDCIFKYDTINKKISVYAKSNLNKDTNLYISDHNFLTSFQGEEKFDEIITQLSVYGKDNISVTRHNPLGTTYIEDFSYYINNHYMRPSLEQAVVNYNNIVNSHKGDFNNYLTQLTKLENTKTIKETELSNLKTQLTILEDQEYVAISAGQQAINSIDLSSIKSQKTNKQNEINSKKNEIDSIQMQIDTVNNNIKTLQALISKETNFTSEQLKELDFYIHQSSWSDTNITDEEILYTKSLDALNKINKPVLEYSNIGIAYFLEIIKYQKDWDKLSSLHLGDFVTINYDKYGDVFLRLVGITRDFINKKLTIDLSSKSIKDDVTRYLGDIFASSTSVATSVSMKSYIWDLSEITSQQISDLISSNLDSSKNNILAGIHQEVVVDGHGIKLASMDRPNEQLRLLSNVIAFTSDGWNTANLAITPSGIVGQNIYGKVIGSTKLMITNTNGSFVVDGNKMTANNMILSLTTTTGNGRIYIDPSTGIKIQNNSSGSWKDTLYMDTEGHLKIQNGYISLTSSNNTIKIDPTVGIQILNSGTPVFYADTNGKLVLKDIQIMGTNNNSNVFADENGLILEALQGQVIFFSNGASLDTGGSAVRLRKTSGDYIYISGSYFDYYQNGSVIFSVSQSGVYFKGNKLATEAYVQANAYVPPPSP